MLDSQRLAQQRIVEQVYLADRQIVRGPPVGVQRAEFLTRQDSGWACHGRVVDHSSRLYAWPVAHETESAAGHELTFDGELLLWLGDESPGVRAADAERIRDIAAEFARGQA